MAVNDTWLRTRTVTPITTGDTDIALVSIPLNDTILRIHGGVALIIALPNGTPFTAVENNHIVMGLYTTLTTGGSIQNPSSNPGDFAPPLQRWLWWEQMFPIAEAVTDRPTNDTRQRYVYTPAQNPLDIKSQVKATTPITLHLGIHCSAIPAQIKVFDMWSWFSVLRSGLLSAGFDVKPAS